MIDQNKYLCLHVAQTKVELRHTTIARDMRLETKKGLVIHQCSAVAQALIKLASQEKIDGIEEGLVRH